MADVGFRLVCSANIPMSKALEVTVGEPILVKKNAGMYSGNKLLLLRDGTLIVEDLMSKDGGKIWLPCQNIGGLAIELSNRTIIAAIPFAIPRDLTKPAGWGKATCLHSTNGWQTVEPFEATFHFPDAVGGFNPDNPGDQEIFYNSVGYCEHDIIELADGSLIMTVYGFFSNKRDLSDYQRYPITTLQ